MITRNIVINAPPEHVFSVFAERIDLWWPPGHRRYPRPLGTLTVEGEPGGRIFERSNEGDEWDLGQVHDWSPPGCLIYDFYPGSGEQHPSRVELRFVAVEGGCEVQLRHLQHKVSDEIWGATHPRYLRSWDAIFVALCAHLDPAAKSI